MSREKTPFLITNEAAYRHWRERKLAAFAGGFPEAAHPIEIADPDAPGDAELTALAAQCRCCGFAFYRFATDDCDTAMLKQFWTRLGLHTLVANPCADEALISRIEATPGARYIPYTERPLKWHTDGYYGTADTGVVRAFAMHCVRSSGHGGENRWFDPEILYIRLRDENPDYVAALMHPQTLTVPPNPDEANLPGGEQPRTAPVLSLHPASGDLTMHYTERARNVTWRDDTATSAARAFIRDTLTAGKPCVTHRLEAGEGVICNNALHDRAGFSGATTKGSRLLYRARYADRIADTGWQSLC